MDTSQNYLDTVLVTIKKNFVLYRYCISKQSDSPQAEQSPRRPEDSDHFRDVSKKFDTFSFSQV